ncbi:MAG: hypothetical protein JNL88_05155 [Bacteroidia bacterium]|nr:hypothetical protein [Bacteroidia bacterium]
MEKLHSYVYSSLDLLQHYRGEMPLHLYLKKQFRLNRKFGSRDRRWIRQLCYAWFRTGGLFRKEEPLQRLLFSFYLLTDQEDQTAMDILQPAALHPLDFTLSRQAKLKQISEKTGERREEDLFPYLEQLSPLPDVQAFIGSLYQQPLVWLRARRAHLSKVLDRLEAAGIAFSVHPVEPMAISLAPGTALETTGVLERGWAEIQDLSSQRTLHFMDPAPGENWLDACAASGGKSLLLMEREPSVRLTVCDNRASILKNLEERFRQNGITSYTKILADLCDPLSLAGFPHFDGIIADVPCSGSGTWARNPEQMEFFNTESLYHYVRVQEMISTNLSGLLRTGGKMLYITCSVFKAENEDRTAALASKHGFRIQKEGIIQGSAEGADTLFASLLIKK